MTYLHERKGSRKDGCVASLLDVEIDHLLDEHGHVCELLTDLNKNRWLRTVEVVFPAIQLCSLPPETVPTFHHLVKSHKSGNEH